MRRGMSCSDGMQSANDDVDPYSAADLMGMRAWARYCERWNPMRWWPKCLKRRRSA
jgi:hypothetical protein